MIFNLTPIIENDINEVAKALNPHWKREEFPFLLYKGDNVFAKCNCLMIYLSPYIMSYTKEFGKGYNREIWIECQLVVGRKENIKDSAIFMVEEFKKLPLKPFKDEDAFFQYFNKTRYIDDDHAISFYMNPDYPAGWWCNHTL